MKYIDGMITFLKQKNIVFEPLNATISGPYTDTGPGPSGLQHASNCFCLHPQLMLLVKNRSRSNRTIAKWHKTEVVEKGRGTNIWAQKPRTRGDDCIIPHTVLKVCYFWQNYDRNILHGPKCARP